MTIAIAYAGTNLRYLQRLDQMMTAAMTAASAMTAAAAPKMTKMITVTGIFLSDDDLSCPSFPEYSDTGFSVKCHI